MKCYICNAQMENDTIKHTPEYGRGNFGPCGTCQAIIAEVFEPLDEEEVDKQLSLEWGEEVLYDPFNEEEADDPNT